MQDENLERENPVSVEDLFLASQETYAQAQQRAQEENKAFARTEFFRMDKLGVYPPARAAHRADHRRRPCPSGLRIPRPPTAARTGETFHGRQSLVPVRDRSASYRRRLSAGPDRHLPQGRRGGSQGTRGTTNWPRKSGAAASAAASNTATAMRSTSSTSTNGPKDSSFSRSRTASSKTSTSGNSNSGRRNWPRTPTIPVPCARYTMPIR